MNPRYFPALYIFTLHLVAAQPIKYVLVGQTDSLNPDVKTSDEVQILWKHNGDKVVEFNGNEEVVYDPYKDRVILNWHTAELEITGLTYEDSGFYELEVYVNKKLVRSHFEMKVIDKVSKPTISCEIVKEGTNSAESGNRATLMCSAESRRSESLMKIEWSSHGNIVSGPNLTISLGDQHDDEEYNCTVSNPLSGETKTFTARDCHPAANSAVIIVGVCVLIAILLVVGLLLFRKLRPKCGSEEIQGNPEELPSFDGQAPPLSPQGPGLAPGYVKELAGKWERNMDAKNMIPRKPIRSFIDPVESSEKEEKSGNPEEQPLIDRQSTFPSPHRLASLAPKTDETEPDEIFTEEKSGTPEEQPLIGEQSSPASAPKTEDTESDQKSPDAENMSPRKPSRSFVKVESSEKESRKGTDGGNKTIPAPAHPNDVCTSPSVQPSSPSALSSSNAPHEGNIGEHQEEANLGQVNGEKVTVGESGLEEGKELGNNVKPQVPPSLEHKQKEMATPKQKSEPTVSHTSSIDNSKGLDDQENTSQQFDTSKVSKDENSLPHELPQPPNAKDTVADDQLEKNNTMCDRQSDSSSEDTSEEFERSATQQEDQVTEKAKLRKAKDSEEVLPADEAKKASTEAQTSQHVEKESHPATVSQPEDEQSHEDDQKDNNQRSESSKQEKHDPPSPYSNSRRSSQSQSSSYEAERGESESKNEEPKDEAIEHEHKPNSDQVDEKSDLGADEESPTPQHQVQETEGANKEREQHS